MTERQTAAQLWRWPAFALLCFVWGSTYLAVALALPAIPPFLLMGVRSFVGGAILFAWSWSRGNALPRAAWAGAALCGLLFFVGCHGLLAFAQQRVPSGLAAIFLATVPFWIAAIELVAPGRKRTKAWALTLLIPGLVGVGVVALADTGGLRHPRPLDLPILLVASLSWAIGTVASQRLRPAAASPAAFSGVALLVGGLVLLGLSRLSGEAAHMAWTKFNWLAAGALLYLILAGTVIAFAAYLWLLDHMAATVVGTYTFVNPVVAVVLGAVVLHEPLTLRMMAGGLIVCASIAALLRLDRLDAAGRR